MRNTLSIHKTLITLAIILLSLSFGDRQLKAQSPAIGPSGNVGQNGGELSYFLLRSVVQAKSMDIVNNVNSRLKAQDKPIKVEFTQIKGWAPRMMDTTFFDRPNSHIARTSFIVQLKIKIPVASDRSLFIPIDVDTSCDGWQTGQGKIKVVSNPGPISVEGGSILEDIIPVRNYIDSQIHANLPTMMQTTAPQFLADPRCVSLAVNSLETPRPDDDIVQFGRPAARNVRVFGSETVEVTFDKIKRLAARDRAGRPLYSENEQLKLDLFANYDQRQKTLTMREGDEVQLDLPSVSLNAALYDKLVIQGSLELPPYNDQDSAFKVSLKQANFQPGTYTIKIPKHYIVQAGFGSNKPMTTAVDAYELTYTVKYRNSSVFTRPTKVLGRN